MLRLIVSILAGLACTAPVMAQESDLLPAPKNLCYRDSCSPQQLSIWNEFQQAETIGEENLSKVYSGGCFFKGRGYNSSHEHHGVVYLDSNEGKVHYTGRFGFFHKQNPFATWTPSDVQEKMTPNRTEKTVVHFEESYAWADLNPGNVPIMHYYFKHTGETLWLIGRWDVTHTLFCELKDNAARD